MLLRSIHTSLHVPLRYTLRKESMGRRVLCTMLNLSIYKSIGKTMRFLFQGQNYFSHPELKAKILDLLIL